MPAPAPTPAESDLSSRRAAQGRAWTMPENWDGDDYIGPGVPPWGRKVRCPAVRQGRRCRKAVIPGGNVCNTHGGAAPQVRNRAKLRLLSLVDPALSTLARTMVDGNASLELKTKIAFGILDRTGMGKAPDVSADVAKAVLMDRYRAMREKLAEEREAAGLPTLEAEWEAASDSVDAEPLEDDDEDSAVDELVDPAGDSTPPPNPERETP